MDKPSFDPIEAYAFAADCWGKEEDTDNLNPGRFVPTLTATRDEANGVSPAFIREVAR